MSPRILASLIHVLFFVSGLTGLVYQVAWVRMFGVVFGNTTHAVSTVLAAFMGGLALGSLLFGRAGARIGRPIRAYGVLEILIGAFAFVFPWLLAGLENVYGAVFRRFGENTLPLASVRFLLSFLMVLVPTTLMGGTLPVLSKFAGRELPRVGRRIGALYAVNTFGAVTGAILAGFVMLEVFGVGLSVRLSAAASVLVGILAVLAGDRAEPRAEAESAPAPEPAPAAGPAGAPGLSPGAARLVLVAFAVSGGLALAYEVLYTRVLVFTLGSSAHAFAVMLSTFLVGIAAGSFVVSRRVDRWRSPVRAFGIVEIALGFAVLASVAVLAELPRMHHALGIMRLGGGDFVRIRGAAFLETAVVLLVPTLLLGATFPLVTRVLVRSAAGASRAVGGLYFYNTIGGVAGSLAAGFVLVPWLGTVRSFALAAAANVALGLLLLSATGRRRRWLLAAAAAAAVAVTGAVRVDPALFTRTFNIGHDDSRLLAFREGVTGTVTVHRYHDYDLIAVDGINVAGTSYMLRITQKLQAHIPVLLAGHPRKVAHIGFGTGESLRVLTLHRIPAIDGIEICPDIVTTSQRYFGAINRNAFESPGVRIVFMDGKNYVRLTDETYDVIMTDSVYPGAGHAGSALYTYDHFRAGRERLNPGGVLSCWLPLDMSNADLKIILGSFRAAFPEMSVWYGWSDATQHALLVGRKDAPITIDWAQLAEAWARPEVREDLADIGVTDPVELASCLLLDSEGAERLGRDAPLHTDDFPALEFGIARRGITRQHLSVNMEEILAVRADPARLLANVEETGADAEALVAAIGRRTAVSSRVIRGHMAFAMESGGLAERHYRKALEIDPEDPTARRMLGLLARALEAEEAVATVAPDDYEGLLASGRRLLAAGRLDAAREALEQAVALRPAEAEPRAMLGECLFRENRLEEALAHLVVARARQPDHVGTLLLLGVCYERAGRAAEARAAYEAAVAAGPDNFLVRTNLGNLYLEAGELARAREHFRAARDLAPGKPAAPFNLGVTAARERQWEEAVRWFETTIELRPSFFRAHFELGKARQALGDREGARRAWERTLELRPDHEGARQALEALSAGAY